MFEQQQDRNIYRTGPCDLCGHDHDEALSCDEAHVESIAGRMVHDGRKG